MRALLAALLVLAGPLPAAAAPVDEYVGRPITRVTIDVEGVVTTEGTLLDLVETDPGEALSIRDVRETVAHIFGLGRYEDVRVHAALDGPGVSLRYELLPAHAVGRIEFTGTLGVSPRQLRRAVTERFGLTPDAARASDVVKMLEGFYRDAGFPQATIAVRPTIQHAIERTTLTFEVQAGPRVRIARVTLEGNAPGSLDAARRDIGIDAGDPYDRREVVARLAEYVADLRERGYYEATADHTVTLSPDRRTADLAIAVDGGSLITLVFEGDPIPEKVREDLVPVEREGSVDEDLLEDASRRLADYLRAQGYRDAEVPYTRTPKDAHLAIVFTVRRGPQYRVGRVEISGNAGVPLAELAPLMRVREGEPFVESVLDGDLARLADAFRRRGFSAATLQPAISTEPGADPIPVTVRIVVQEGPRTLIGSVAIAGNEAVTEALLRPHVGSRPGQPFVQAQLAIDRDALLYEYLNRGYRRAEIAVATAFTPDRGRVDVRFTVREGPQVLVDHVLVVGNERTSHETIRREITLAPGDPLSIEAIAETQRRLSALGLFRRVRLTEIAHGSEARRDLLVSVDEAPATTIGYGGGVEVGRRLVQQDDDTASERFEVAPRGFFEVGRRNLFGRNRSVNLFTRVSLRLRSESVPTRDGVQPAADFNEYRVLGTYRQPRFFGPADFLATGFLEQGARTSFDFRRQGARAELARRITPRLSLSGRYALDRTEVFNASIAPDDELLIDRLFPQVRLSSFSSSLVRDTRDDPLNPSAGTLVGADNELAARSLGSEVGFMKSFVQGFLYRRLPGRRGVVLAAGGRLGLAAGFAREVPRVGGDGEPLVASDGAPLVEIVDDLPASERFFSGGDTTVRGFGLDQLGTTETLDARGFPKGGNAVVVLNAELRVPVWGDLGAVAFVDAGNVFARVSDVSVTEIRGAAGVGLRYRSPIGPIRVDLGFKLDREMLPNGQLERRTALHISLGQAF